MKIKKGDEVVVVAGKDKGVAGKVVSVDRDRDRVVVEGVNMVQRAKKVTHQGPRGAKEGGLVHKEASIHVSNVMLAEGGKPVRAGFETKDDGTKKRVSRRTGKDI